MVCVTPERFTCQWCGSQVAALGWNGTLARWGLVGGPQVVGVCPREHWSPGVRSPENELLQSLRKNWNLALASCLGR